MNTHKKGQAGKKHIRDWYRGQGYEAEYVEKLQAIFTKNGMIFKKEDLFDSDGISMSKEKNEIVFWNSKSSVSAMMSDLHKFRSHRFPEFVVREICVWEPYKKNPHRLRVQNKTITQIDTDNKSKIIAKYED